MFVLLLPINYIYCFSLFNSGLKHICKGQDFYFLLKLEEDPAELMNKNLI